MPNRKKSSITKTESITENILLVTGEHSGDNLASDLIQELKKHKPNTSFFGVGGEKSEGQGLESLEVLENLSVVGFSEALKKYMFLRKLFYRLLDECNLRQVRLAILIDYPGFNLRLAKELKKRGIKVVFYVSPQIWAWKFKRIFFIKKHVDLMLTLFRFEEELYLEYGVNAKYVGHPLVKTIPEKLLTEPKIRELIEIKRQDTVIGLLPGSRRQEIKKLTTDILKSAELLFLRFTELGKPIVFLLPNINKKMETYIQKQLEVLSKKHPQMRIHYIFDASLSVMQASDLLLIASGTATLEGLYFKKPMVILYRVSLFTYFLGAMLLKSKYFGLVNILSKEEVCLELFQNDCKPSRIFKEAKLILENEAFRKKIEDKLRITKQRELEIQNSSERASLAILEILNSLPEESDNSLFPSSNPNLGT